MADSRLTIEEGSGLVGDGAELPEGMRESLANQEPTTVTYWFTGDRAARVDKSGSIISRLDRSEAYFVNTDAKTYTVIEMGGPEDGPAPTAVSKLVQSGETRKIASWNTVRYDMTIEMGDEPAEIVLWVSDEVDVDLSSYRAFVEAMADSQGMEWMKSFLEIDGYPVRQEFRMGPILSWQQLVSVSQEPAPAGTYEAPAGFAKVD
ncbi:MAG: DUF4412 domain-containing protein [Thermoanaerobaculia bacterium]